MGRRVGDWFHYSGAVHIHTTESDGVEPLERVIEFGREVGLDFMMFADHMTLSNRERGGEGMYGETLVVIGYEHNDAADHHHYLLFESPRVYPNQMSARQYVAAGARDNAIGILAHPDEIRDRMEEYPPYPWTDWKVEGYVGIELWNQMSEWMERLTPFNKLLMALSPRKSMVGPTDRILAKWDELNQRRKVVGIASVDAHAFEHKAGPLKLRIFPYKVHFKCLRTHIILDEPMAAEFEVAKAQLYDALRDCRVFFSNMRWGDANEFEFFIDNGQNRAAAGGEVPLIEGTIVTVRVPQAARLILIRDGEPVAETSGTEMSEPAGQPGLYRVEAWLGDRGWIFSNHVRVTA